MDVIPLMLTNLKLDRLVKSFNPGASPFPTSVPGETLLAVPPVNKTVMEGETVSFDCVSKGEKSVVNWFREGTEISKIEVSEIDPQHLSITFAPSVAQKLINRDRTSNGERPSPTMDS